MAERDRYGANDIKPGLTGLAQINGRDELEIPVKAKFDGEYVKALKKGMTSGFLMDTLSRTYESLKQQDCKRFIWLIVDDGSTDNTRELVRGWQEQDNGFEIRYIFKENGGMHTAHNTAYSFHIE